MMDELPEDDITAMRRARSIIVAKLRNMSSLFYGSRFPSLIDAFEQISLSSIVCAQPAE